MERAVPTDSTLKRKGRSAPNCGRAAPSSSGRSRRSISSGFPVYPLSARSEGAEGCVPILQQGRKREV